MLCTCLLEIHARAESQILKIRNLVWVAGTQIWKQCELQTDTGTEVHRWIFVNWFGVWRSLGLLYVLIWLACVTLPILATNGMLVWSLGVVKKWPRHSKNVEVFICANSNSAIKKRQTKWAEIWGKGTWRGGGGGGGGGRKIPDWLVMWSILVQSPWLDNDN